MEWSGECVNGYANGSGKLEWFINRELIEVYEGDMSEGWASVKVLLYQKMVIDTKVVGKKYSKWFWNSRNFRWLQIRGNWENGKQHGWGTLIQPTGKVFLENGLKVNL